MKYNVIEVLRALEACYVCDYNPLSVKEFIELFCDRYELNIEHEERRIKGMLRVLDKQEKIIICDDMIYLENMLHSGIKLGIMG